jgi:hypothetical protein
MWLLKLDSDGNVEWEKTYGGSDIDDALFVQQTTDGGYVATGITKSFDLDNFDFWVVKVDSSGNIDNCVSEDIVQQTSASVETTNANITDTAVEVQATNGTVTDTDADVEDTSARIDTQCGPGIVPGISYGLELLEQSSVPSDGTINLDQEILVKASTNDDFVDQITFRWMRPNQDLARETTVPSSKPSDTFAPDEPGRWTVEADFNNGQVLRKTLDVAFFVLPESPIGAIAMITASMASLGAFLYFRMARRPFLG